MAVNVAFAELRPAAFASEVLIYPDVFSLDGTRVAHNTPNQNFIRELK